MGGLTPHSSLGGDHSSLHGYEPKPPSPMVAYTPRGQYASTPGSQSSRRGSEASSMLSNTPFHSRPPSAREAKTMVRLEGRPGSGKSGGSGGGGGGNGIHHTKLNKVTDRIAIYSTDLKNEARIKREGDERRAAMVREQVRSNMPLTKSPTFAAPTLTHSAPSKCDSRRAHPLFPSPLRSSNVKRTSWMSANSGRRRTK